MTLSSLRDGQLHLCCVVDIEIACAKEGGSYYQDKVSTLIGCYESKKDNDTNTIIQMANTTFDHIGIPIILVSGVPTRGNATVMTVCNEYNGANLHDSCTGLLGKVLVSIDE